MKRASISYLEWCKQAVRAFQQHWRASNEIIWLRDETCISERKLKQLTPFFHSHRIYLVTSITLDKSEIHLSNL